jgi:hypothetical protein
MHKKENALIDSASVNHFYSFVNSKLKRNTPVAPLLNANKVLCTDDTEKACLLNTVFGSIFTLDNGITPPLCSVDSSVQTDSSNVIFSYYIVFKTLSNLPPKTSKSPDGYPALFLNRWHRLLQALCPYYLPCLFYLEFYRLSGKQQ